MSIFTTGDLEKMKFDDPSSRTPAVRVFSAGLLNVQYDYVSVAYPNATTETYTFKTGGSSGTTVRVITVTYTDSTKENLSSAARTS